MVVTAFSVFALAKTQLLEISILKKHKYPPEGMEDAVKTVMTQFELWTDNQEFDMIN